MAISTLLAGVVAACAQSEADWPAHRGGPARLGCVDGIEGPLKPAVRWVLRSGEHHVAPLAAAGGRLYVSALGGFGSGCLHAFDLGTPDAPLKAWTYGPPLLGGPIVCAPAIAGGMLVFGDGMHQSEGGSLQCVRARDKRLLWKLDLSGNLIHLEASPSIVAGAVYAGAGHGGVLCVELEQVVLDGRDLPLHESEALVDRRWKDLVRRHEEELKTDPDFAVPPQESSLKRPAPKMRWQRGRGTWHVDAPVAVAGDRVLAASSRLERERSGVNALLCLRSDDGSELWNTPLPYSPWGGPVAAGDRVFLGLSSIRYDPKEVDSAQGEVAAYRLSDGTVEWRRALDAAVLASVVATDKLLLLADTKGRLHALDPRTGESRWVYGAGAPFFAGPAVGPAAAYIPDLSGIVHAVSLSDGSRRWTLDLGTHPEVRGAGRVFGSPALHRGCLYVATCDLNGAATGTRTAVVAIGPAP